MTNRTVTIEDFIKDEFKGKDPNDYEFRGDGKIVRKDRWEAGIHNIHNLLVSYGVLKNHDEFEIEEIFKSVEGLLALWVSNQKLKAAMGTGVMLLASENNDGVNLCNDLNEKLNNILAIQKSKGY